MGPRSSQPLAPPGGDSHDRDMRPYVVYIGFFLCLLGGCVRLHRASTGPRSMVGWTQQTWEADPRRLETDLGRCVEGLHWAAVAIEQRPAALELDRSGRELASTMVWKLRALTPDGRQAQLIAWSAEGRRIEARALVGRFGDEEKQQWLLDELQKVMAGPALRARHDKFSLPLMGP